MARHGRMNGNGQRFHEELVPLKGGPIDDPPPKRASPRERCMSVATMLASAAAFVLCVWALVAFLLVGHQNDQDGLGDSDDATPVKTESVALYDDLGRYVAEDYDAQPPFADFLPALAGYYGKPLYAFYVNRGQGIASFGVEDKDHPIMEFNPANKAYQSSALLGFRTFLQASRRGKAFLTEPFSVLTARRGQSSESFRLPKRYMYVGANEMQVQEIDSVHGIETNVSFYVLPEEDFGAFFKRTVITNTQESQLTVSMLDGLAKIEPAGGKMDKLLKNMGRTLEGWMGVYQPYDDTIKMPYYRLSTQPKDTAAVQAQVAGHWCLSIVENDDSTDLLPIIYDTSKVFGQDTSLITPVELYDKSIREIIGGPQYGFAKTSSAFAAVDEMILAPGESLTVSTFFGKTQNVLDVPVIARRLLQPGFVEYKVKRTQEVIKQITASLETRTSNPLFDGHVQQIFLDNSLRGGIPSILGEVDDDAKMKSADEDPRLKVYHLFSRIHGDLERDYNDFEISSTFFSQGPGNFRDIAQNRRTDVIFNPRIGAFNVKSFLSFIQADGYEPLSVEAVIFVIPDLDKCLDIATMAVGQADGHRAQREALTGILNSGPFRPGQLFLLMEEQSIELIISRQEFIDTVAAAADSYPMAVFKDGFWADHFTYYMDLVESYLAIYPDREQQLMFDERLPYFFSPASVKPRSEKYVLDTSFDGLSKHVRQLDATKDDEEAKVFQMGYIENTTGWFGFEANWQHNASNEIFQSSPIEKLFLLATVKFATRDPYGMGIEYEGGKPGWDDANNGLVGMVGSGMPETYELLVILQYLSETISKYDRPIAIPVELGTLVDEIGVALDNLASVPVEANITYTKVPKSLFRYWDAVATARENYREAVKVVFSGKTRRLDPSESLPILHRWVSEVELGVERALNFGTHGKGDKGNTGITPTYFSYNVVEWTLTGKKNKDGHPLVKADKIEVGRFPLFLEGPTRMMKTVDPGKALEIYNNVRFSPLRDETLGMYTISASLKGQSLDMGREMAFAAGWLENESVWLHMSYKFYLELIRNGLFNQFFEEMVNGGMLPFMDPDVYGRSLMECSSFIASSAFEDPEVRGRGFLARLSGSTAEFLSMWALMMLGPHPFYVEGTGELRMQLLPALPRWLFRDKKDGSPARLSFKLFGSIDVTYHHNRGDQNLFRAAPSRYVVVLRDGSTFHVGGPSVPFSLADKIRRVVFVASIDAYFE